MDKKIISGLGVSFIALIVATTLMFSVSYKICDNGWEKTDVDKIYYCKDWDVNNSLPYLACTGLKVAVTMPSFSISLTVSILITVSH